MAIRHQYECCDDIGHFSKLTNAYCLVTNEASENFYRMLQHLEFAVPSLVQAAPPKSPKSLDMLLFVVHSFHILSIGNKNGLLVPQETNDQEIQHLRNNLPDQVVVKRIEVEPLNLGSCISCNDYIALMHPDLEPEIEELIADVLGVDVFKRTVDGEDYVGNYCVFNSKGGLVTRRTSFKERNELSELLQVPVVAGTVNKGKRIISGGLMVNDSTAFCGLRTTATEISVIESVFKLNKAQPSMIMN